MFVSLIQINPRMMNEMSRMMNGHNQGRRHHNIRVGGVMHPLTFSNFSVCTILTPTFQCIDPPPSNSWRRP